MQTKDDQPQWDLLTLRAMAKRISQKLDQLPASELSAIPEITSLFQQLLQLQEDLGQSHKLNGKEQIEKSMSDRGQPGLQASFSDVAEQKAITQKIAAEGEWFRVTLSSIGDAVIATDSNGRVTFLNPVAERLTGWTNLEAAGKTLEAVFKIINEKTHLPVENLVKEVIQEGVVIGLENHTVLISKNGKVIPIEDSAAPIKDSNGDILGAIVVFHDVTEKRMREVFSQAINEIDLLLNSTLDVDEVMRRAVSAAAKAIGSETAALSLRENGSWVVRYSYGFPEDIAGMQMNDQQEWHALQAIRTKQPIAISDTYNDERLDQEHIHKFRIRSVLVVPVILHDEAIGCAYFNYHQRVFEFTQTHIDFATQLAASISLALENASLIRSLEEEIVFRERAETALKANKQRLEEILESIQDGFVQLDQKWCFTYVNSKSAANLGWEPQALLGKNIWETFPKILGTAHEHYYRLVMEKRQSAHFEIPGVLTKKFYNIRVYPSQDGIAIFLMDITERKISEQQAHAHAIQIELQQRLLEQREQERQLIAHDLHDGPVQELTGAYYILAEIKSSAQDQTQDQKLQMVAEIIKNQISELRAYAGELRPPTISQFGLGKTIRSYLETFQKNHPEISVHFEEMQDGDLIPRQMRLAMFRIVQESLTNIIKHSQATTVTVCLTKTHEQATLEIADNGTGFEVPEDFLTLARQGHLGLVGMNERVEVLGGQIEIKSKKGKGTTIQVTVPLGQSLPLLTYN